MKNKGFTLLELSIVIVIIGLIVAGISAGQSLVKQAQLRGLVSEVEQVKLAINAFKLQYDELPGDMPNAHSYWSGCTTGASASECNGNGDGIVSFAGASHDDREPLRLWQHLSLAGLIDGTYTGVYTTSWTSENYLFSSLPGVMFNIASSPSDHFFRASGGNTVLSINLGGTIGGSTTGSVHHASLPVIDALFLDKKLDDGTANTGRIITPDGLANPPAAGSCSAAYTTLGGADYNLSNADDDTAYCTPFIIL